MGFYINVQIAMESIKIVKNGQYSVDGETILIEKEVENMMENTLLYLPDDFADLKDKVEVARNNELSKNKKTIISVTPETTTMAMQRLAKNSPACLNFASGVTPGGGFLNGSNAQEESLARASSLYESIRNQKDFYSFNKATKSRLYSDHIIYSPNVVFFRDDAGKLMKDYYTGSVITSPAVNLRNIEVTPTFMSEVHRIMTKRIEKILDVAILNGHNTLVLGAFGCGVFSNDPRHVADYFKQLIGEGGIYENVFDKIVFAIPVFDNKKDFNNMVFKSVFEGA